MSEEQIGAAQSAQEQQAPTKEEALSKNELLAALESDFATGVTKIYLNSVGREYAFREITVKEQKTLTRIISGNENRKDVIFDAQCALVNDAALDKDFDIYKFSEFDRMKILIALYQANMFQNEVKFTCEECGAENKYKVDFDVTLQKLDEYKLERKIHVYDTKRFKYTFECEYPSVKLVSAFHKAYCAKTGTNVAKRQVKGNNVVSNLEYVDLFIRSVRIENNENGTSRYVALRNYDVKDVEDILQAFPQDALYSDAGVLKFVVEQYLKPVNETFGEHKCAFCGTSHEKENQDNVESFF